VLPRDPAHALVAAAAGAIVFAAAWRAERPRRVLIAIAPLVLLFLPWLPFRVPPAFFAWTGALASIVWVAVAISLAAVLRPARVRVPQALVSTPWAPGLLAALIFALAAWGVSSVRPGGDEPHYLVITQSLLLDGDLQIANNHRRGDYRVYFAGDLAPHVGRPGRHGESYSIHAPGLPALVLPAFALGGYVGVVVFLIAVSAAGCALAWWLAWRTTGNAAAAWFGWAGVTIAAPLLLESFTVFPDGPGAVVVLTGFWAVLRAETNTAAERSRDTVPWFLHGLALALLPWMHTRFAVLAGTLGGLILVRIARVSNPLGKAVAFLAAPAVSALAWLFFFTILYGTPDPSAPYGRDTQNSLAYFPNGLGGLLFDQGFGLFATAPVLLVAVAGFTRARRLAAEWLVVAVPYLLAVATFAMWWAGMSGPARFLVPLILPLAVPLACAWASARSLAPRALMIAALVVSAWVSALMAGGDGGRLAYHTRNEAGPTAAPFLERASHVVDLPAALPAFVPQPVQPDPGGLVSRARAVRSGFAVTLIWALCLSAAAVLVRRTLRTPQAQTAGIELAVTITTFAFSAALMIAASIVWRVYDSEPEVKAAAAQMNVLRRLAAAPQAAVGLVPPRRLTETDAWSMRVDVPIRRARGGVRTNAPLAAFPAVPAGSYLVSARRHGGGDGWLMLGVGNDQFAIVTLPIARFDEGVRIDLPIDVRALLVRADEGARAQLDAIDLRPVSRAGPRLSSDAAKRAVRYDAAVVFFLDDRAFPEPSGFWVAGERTTRVAVRPDGGRPAALSLRNGAVENTVVLESGAWRENVTMPAGEERRIDVPLNQAGAALLTIRSTAGFRPSEVNSESRDTRFLGVFVRPVS